MDQKDILSHANHRAFWTAAVDLWRSSGLSMAEFCRREKLVCKKFCAWRKRIEPQPAESSLPSNSAVGVPPSTPAKAAA